jgi:hypothetical protein
VTYTKIAQESLTDAKMAGLTDRAFRLYVNGLVYSNFCLTDGYVPDAVLNLLVPTGSPKTIKAAVAELRAAKLWAWKPPLGHYVMDFAKHQLTKAQLEDRIEQKRKAANQRWYPDAGKGTNAHASAMQTHSESNGDARASAMPVLRTPSSVLRPSKKNVRTKRQNGDSSEIGDALARVRAGIPVG